MLGDKEVTLENCGHSNESAVASESRSCEGRELGDWETTAKKGAPLIGRWGSAKPQTAPYLSATELIGGGGGSLEKFGRRKKSSRSEE